MSLQRYLDQHLFPDLTDVVLEYIPTVVYALISSCQNGEYLPDSSAKLEKERIRLEIKEASIKKFLNDANAFVAHYVLERTNKIVKKLDWKSNFKYCIVLDEDTGDDLEQDGSPTLIIEFHLHSLVSKIYVNNANNMNCFDGHTFSITDHVIT